MKKDQTTLLFVFYPEPLCCSLTTPFHCCGRHRSSGAASRGHLGWRGGVALRWGRAWALPRQGPADEAAPWFIFLSKTYNLLT
jgi:hypothetical protein